MKKAFTLIELLIVVAIIGILAAVAVPNFLNAQMRAKVTRVRADMKAISTAIESYRIDHNSIPYTWDEASNPVGWDWLTITGEEGKHLGRLLTTPISYIASIPIDPFNSKCKSGWIPPTGTNVSFVMTMIKGEFPNTTTKQAIIKYLNVDRTEYGMESCGPDLVWWDGVDGGTYIYTPSNGLLSQGQIVFTDGYGVIE